ncbi:hypothetical protein [Polycyclovorans algicola]|uniref:hypothetical protein n=1 Tax=Polycyclovorans algicola TaxID=616992 RepID=UPI0004A71822|nr:hypothetical protein [Polycyclovorans algicola]
MTRLSSSLHDEWVNAAAQLICTLHLTDYQLAKLKARDQLGLGADAALPDNLSVEAAVLDYLRLFGGDAHVQRLKRLRQTAVQAMRWLSPLDVRLVGAVASGAVTDAHRVQLHAITDDVEAVDFQFLDRGVPFDQGERRYRMTDGRQEAIPLLQFSADGVGLDLAVFTQNHRARPLSPITGRAAKRFRLADVEALLSGG